MAQKINSKLEESLRFPNFAHLHFKIKFSGLIKIWRQCLRKLFAPPVNSDEIKNVDTNLNLDLIQKEFIKNNWAYSDIFWNKEFHDKLVKHWPPNQYFETIQYISKSYDIGFRWSYKDKEYPPYLDAFPAYKLAYDYLSSKEFCDKLIKIVGDDVKRKCYKILMTRAYWGSSIIPHIDSRNDIGNINLVIFIDGTDGGLGIWQDNEFGKEIFIPENLNNTCILYDMSEAFYHGFRPMKLGKYRYTINATYKMVSKE